MKQTTSHKSVWGLDGQLRRPQLTSTMESDVVVIGAGITGLTTALLLKRAGKKVIVLEAQSVGSGTTGHSSAHLTSCWDEGYDQLLERHGQKIARDVYSKMNASINFIEEVSADRGISCDFARVPGYYYAQSSEKKRLTQVREALRALDIPFDTIDRIPLPFVTDRALRVPGQARFHPGKYLQGLAKLVEGRGSHVFENSRVDEFSDGTPCHVVTDSGKVLAEHIVMATHTPLGINPLHTEVAPYRSYLLLCELQNEPGEEMDGLYWDMQEPYHYTRLVNHNNKRLLLVGGADHKTAHDDENSAFALLKSYVHKRYTVTDIVKQWSSQFYTPVDLLPFIGKSVLGDHTYVATGFSGDGLTMGTAAARMITDQICGDEDASQQESFGYYSPSRLQAVAAPKFWKENFDVARHMIQDRMPRSGDNALQKLKPGEGCVASQGISTIAGFCQPDGSLVKFSAVCPHMGGVVRWNQEEKSFDCPCHGARFNTAGKVIEGPALTGLKKL